MSSNSVRRSHASDNVYRIIAEDCLRRARSVQHHEKPFWLNLAQSWLQMAEQSSRNAGAELEPREPPIGQASR
jgi:hypothetical protein